MFGVSFPELLLVLVLVLLVFGPDKLPELARQFGRWTGFLRKTSDSVRRDFYNSIYTPAEDIRKEVEQEKRQLRAVKEELESCCEEHSEEGEKQDV